MKTTITPSRHRPLKQSGFSLTEMLVVIALLMTLLGLAVFAMNKVADASARAGTVGLLNSLVTISTEFETQNNGVAVNHLRSVKVPVDWDTQRFNTDTSRSGLYDPSKPWTYGIDMDNCAGYYPSVPGQYLSPAAATDPPSQDRFRGYLGFHAEVAYGNGATAFKRISGKRFIAGVWNIEVCREQIASLDKRYVTRDKFHQIAYALADGYCHPYWERDPAPPYKPRPDGNLVVVDGLLTPYDGWDTPILYAAYVRYDEPGGDKATEDDFLPKYARPFFISAGPDREYGDSSPSATYEDKVKASDNIYSYDLE